MEKHSQYIVESWKLHKSMAFSLVFFFKDVSMNIHEKEKQTKTGGG